MAVALVGTPVAVSAASGTPWTLTVPTGTAAGQQAYCFLDVQATNSVVNTPTGWTLIQTHNSSSDMHFLYQRTLVTADVGATFSAPIAGGSGGSAIRRIAHTLVFSGANANPHAVGFASEGATAVTAHTTPTVTTTTDNCWVVIHEGERQALGSTSYTFPTVTPAFGTSLITTQTGTSQMASVTNQRGPITPAGSAGGSVVTGNQATSNAGMWVVAIAPTGASPTFVAGNYYQLLSGGWS
jgi:hypothetical protein